MNTTSDTPRTDASACDIMGDQLRWVAADFARTLERELAEARKENTILRGLLPKLNVPCPHCGETDMAKCKFGFPGCSYADDLMLGQDEATKELLEKYCVTKQDSERLDKLERIVFSHEINVFANDGKIMAGPYKGLSSYPTLRAAIDAVKKD